MLFYKMQEKKYKVKIVILASSKDEAELKLNKILENNQEIEEMEFSSMQEI